MLDFISTLKISISLIDILSLPSFQNPANPIIVQQETESESEDYGKDVVSCFGSHFLILNFTLQKSNRSPLNKLTNCFK